MKTVRISERSTGMLRNCRPTKRRRYRPRLESLEDRCLLSSLGISEIAVPGSNSIPQNIVADANGNLWFTAGGIGKIGEINCMTNAVSEFRVPSPSFVDGITLGPKPDNDLWFTDSGQNAIGKIDPSTDKVTEFHVPTDNSQVGGITTGPDGNLWFTELQSGKIGEITPAGAITEFSLPSGTFPNDIISADGNLWFTQSSPDAIAEFNPATPQTVNLKTSGSFPAGLTLGPDGNLWFVEALGNRIGQLDPHTLALNEYSTGLTANAFQQGFEHGITTGPDGNLWFTETQASQIGEITTAGTISEFPATVNCQPLGITAADGKVWFTETNTNNSNNIDHIGVFTPPPAPQPAVDVGYIHLAVQGGAFVSNSATGTIDIGDVPTAGNPFVPLLEVNGTVSFTATDIHVDGTVTTSVSGTSIPLFQGSFDFSPNVLSFSLPGAGISNQFQVAGLTVTLEAVGFFGSALLLQGTVVLPGGATLAVDGNNVFVISQATGVSMTGATLAAGGNLDLGIPGLNMVVSGLSAVYSSANDDLRIQGTVTFPDLYDATADFTGDQGTNNFIDIQNGVVTVSTTLSIGQFTVPGGVWTVNNAQLTIDTTTASVSGTCDVSDLSGRDIQLDIGLVNGALSFAADVNNTQIQFAGYDVSIASVYFDSYGMLQVTGSITVPLAAGTSITLDVGPKGINFAGGFFWLPDFDSSFNLFGLAVNAQDVTVAYDSFNDRIILQGTVSLPGIFNVTADFSGADENGNPTNYIQFQNGQASFVGTVSLDNLTIGGFGLTSAYLHFDTVNNGFSGGADLALPFLPGIQGGFGFQNGQLAFINLGVGDVDTNSSTGFQLGQGDLNVPLVAGTFLQGINASLDLSTLQISGSMDITYGPDVEGVPLIDLVLSGTIDSSGLQANGTLSLVGGTVATGTADVSISWGDSASFSATANFNFFDGTVQVGGSLTANDQGLDLTGTATINTPAFDVFGFHLGPIQWGGIHIPSRQLVGVYTELHYVWGAPLSEDYVSGSITASLPWPIGSGTLGAKVTFDGQIDPIINWHDPVTQIVNVPKGATWFLLSAAWQNNVGAVPVTVTAPDGTVYTEAQFDNVNIGLVPGLSTATSDVVGLQNPAPGKWKISLADTAGLGTVRFQGIGQSVPPTIQLTAVHVSGSHATIDYKVQNSDPAARITLLYSTSQGGPGLLIKSNLPAANGTGSFTWNTTSLPSGQYYVSATIDDGQNPSSSSSFGQSITVVNQPPVLKPIADQTIVAGGLLTFAASASDADNERLQFSLGSGAPAGAAIDKYSGQFTWAPAANLATQNYPVTVIVTDNGTGTLSASRTFTIHLHQQPVFSSAAATTLVMGSAGRFAVKTNGVPAPMLSELGKLPKGVTFNTRTGTLTGKPAAGTQGVYELEFSATSVGGDVVTQDFVLTIAQAPAFTSAAETIFATGRPASFQVTASCFPGPATLTESSTDKLPTGITFDAATGVLSGTASGSAGSYTLHFTAHGSAGKDAKQTFTLIVGKPPAFTGAQSTTFTVGVGGSFKLTASGFPKPIFSESSTDVLPKGVKFNAAAGTLTGTPASGTGGTYTLHFTAHNGAGYDVTETFILTIA